MNLKKFISVVSAFAIASSMAVVASADYSEDATTGAKTWDFADYTAENADYSVFAAENGTTISTSGIVYGAHSTATGLADMTAQGYATFTAPADGTLVVTFKADANNTYVNGYVYDGETQVATVNGAGTAGSDTAEIAVTEGTTYTLTIAGRGSTRRGSTKKVVFTPAGYVYNEVTVTPVAVTDEYTTADLKDGLGGVYTAEIENDTEFTLDTVSVSAKANTGQTRGDSVSGVNVAPGSSISIVVLVKGKNPGRITSISATLK